MMRALPFVLVGAASGHGTITIPAMRANDMNPWCPDCYGDQVGCSAHGPSDCAPPTPCYGATPGSLVTAEKFNNLKEVKAPDGTYWIDQNPTKTTWCPGETYTIRFHILADHNGVYRWESQLAAPGSETEAGFVNFTEWISWNADANTKYYHEDGTAWDTESCGSGGAWAPEIAHCKDGTFAETKLTIPNNLPTGETVVRWIWFGAMKTDGSAVVGPEPSLFANCIDMTVGGSSCGTPPAPTPTPTPTPTPPAPSPTPSPDPSNCPGGTLSACIDLCPSDSSAIFAACVESCGRRCPSSIVV